MDPEWFVSDPIPDPTSKEVSAPTPDPAPDPGPASDPDPDSDPATLVSGSRELSGKLALYSWNYDDI
jgi:hypothetical protein